MSSSTQLAFEPRWASAPGETILEILKSRELSLEDLAEHLGISDPNARRLVSGELEITQPLAAELASWLGSTETFWLARDEQYRESLRWVTADDLARKTPVKQLAQFGWIPLEDNWRKQAEQVLNYFGVENARSWAERWDPILVATHYRKSSATETNDAAVAAWLRQAEVQAELLPLAPWSRSKLVGSLKSIRALTKIADPGTFIPKLQEIVSAAGVALVVLPAPIGCPVSGASFLSNTDRRVIAMSGRYRSDDHFWFTLFHEIGHVVRHDFREPFLDSLEPGEDDESALEQEANEFAREALIPGGIGEFDRWKLSGPSSRQVLAFSSSIGIAPGIVVGQLHHDGRLRHNQLRGLIRSYKWVGTSLRT